MSRSGKNRIDKLASFFCSRQRGAFPKVKRDSTGLLARPVTELRKLLEGAYSRTFTDAEICAAASDAAEFMKPITEPEKAWHEPVSPRVFVFTCALLKSETGLSVRAACEEIAALSAKESK